MKSGDINKAYTFLSEEFKANASKEQLIDYLSKSLLPVLKRGAVSIDMPSEEQQVKLIDDAIQVFTEAVRVPEKNKSTRLRRILVHLQGASAGAYLDMCRGQATPKMSQKTSKMVDLFLSGALNDKSMQKFIREGFKVKIRLARGERRKVFSSKRANFGWTLNHLPAVDKRGVLGIA